MRSHSTPCEALLFCFCYGSALLFFFFNADHNNDKEDDDDDFIDACKMNTACIWDGWIGKVLFLLIFHTNST